MNIGIFTALLAASIGPVSDEAKSERQQRDNRSQFSLGTYGAFGKFRGSRRAKQNLRKTFLNQQIYHDHVT